MQQIQQLKRSNSLKIEEGMPVLWPKQEKPGQLKVSKIISSISGKKAYSYNTKVIAFVSDGEMYVTPFTKESLGIIRNAGYKLFEFHIPFSHGDLPMGEYGDLWQELLAKAKAPKQAAATKDPDVIRRHQSAVAPA